MADKFNLKSYKQALEALIGHHTRSKVSSLLSNAAANIHEPELRDTLIVFINKLDFDSSYSIDIGPHKLYKLMHSYGDDEHNYDASDVNIVINHVSKVIESPRPLDTIKASPWKGIEVNQKSNY
jgi:hypothetical protein